MGWVMHFIEIEWGGVSGGLCEEKNQLGNLIVVVGVNSHQSKKFTVGVSFLFSSFSPYGKML